MEVIKTLNAGSPGTKRYQQRYGDRQVCVRYRRDETGKRRLTTVEIVVEDFPLQATRARTDQRTVPAGSQRVLVRIGYNETGCVSASSRPEGGGCPKRRYGSCPHRQ